MSLLAPALDPAAALGWMIAILVSAEWLFEASRAIWNRSAGAGETLPPFPPPQLRVLVFWESFAPILGGLSGSLAAAGMDLVAPPPPLVLPAACVVGLAAVVPLYGVLLQHSLEIPLAGALALQLIFVLQTAGLALAAMAAAQLAVCGRHFLLSAAA